jgi:hypothetical protein
LKENIFADSGAVIQLLPALLKKGNSSDSGCPPRWFAKVEIVLAMVADKPYDCLAVRN